jgi:hypothetical protein
MFLTAKEKDRMASYYRCSRCQHLISVDDYTQDESYYDIDKRLTLEHKWERIICDRNIPTGVNEVKEKPVCRTPIGGVIKDVHLERRIVLK